jgi:pilus assembly protein CpaC
MNVKSEAALPRAIFRAASIALISMAVTLGMSETSSAQQAAMSDVSISDDVDDRLVIQPGTIWTIEVDETFADIAIGDVNVLDAFPLTDRSFYIQTKSVGITNLALYDENSRFIGDIEIQVAIDNPEPKLESLINEAVPGAQVRVSMINNRVYLKGSIQKQSDIDVIIKIAESFRATKEPVIYSFEYPEGEPVIVSVTRQGSATSYTMPRTGNEPQGLVTAYGTTALASEDTETGEPDQPIVINVNGSDGTAESN